MIPQKQKIFDKGKGDCFRACMASILDLPNGEHLPNVHDPEWYLKWMNFLKKFGLRLCHGSNCWKDGYWIASVPSLNLEGSTHAIIMKDIYVAFDPSPKKKYKVGTQLLSKDIVKIGYWLEIDNISLITKLAKYRSGKTHR